MSLLARVRLVLMRPRNPENLGAVARVMKNFGLTAWTIVDPRTLDFAAARRVAVHSEELLDKPEIVASLAEATARASFVVGTSSRRVPGVPVLAPHELGVELARRASQGQEVALVFGDERSGLSNEEVTACHALSRIPVAPEQPSLNLAQSVALYAYETRLACEATPAATPRPTATDAELRALVERASEALTAARFLDPENPRHALSDLLHTFQRAQLSPREYRLWSAVFGALAKAQRRQG